MIGLVTRGYLRRLKPPDVVLVGDGPTIVDSEELKPEISRASTGPQIPAPTISGAQSLTPSVQGVRATAVATPPAAPTIVSGNLLTPVIQGGGEED